MVRGMFVNVEINIPTSDDTLFRLPIKAVRPGDNVWIAADKRLRIIPVSIAQMREGEALVFASETKLTLDDRVIVSRLSTAIEDMEIQETATP